MRLGWFVLGVVATLIALSAAAYVYLGKGYVDARADIEAGPLDQWLGAAMDASTGRHAPKTMSPVVDTEENLVAAAKVYGAKCVICHGGPAGMRSELGDTFLPPAPQFFGNEPPMMMENENFYIIKHGVRMTAMPAWKTLLDDRQIWQLVLLLKHVNDKSVAPAVAQEIRKAAS